MNNSQVSKQGDNYKALREDQLNKVQSRLMTLLENTEYVQPLKKLIERHESLSPSDIERILYSNISKFKPKTQHKIRDFITRRDKMTKPNNNNKEKTFSYQSDSSNLISPSSRESFSSRSESDINSFKINIQSDVVRLWKYTICQKEICQLLYDNDDLEVCSTRSVAIDFEQLKPSSRQALSDYIYEKTILIDQIYKDEELRTIFEIMSNETLDDQTVSDVNDLILRYEHVEPNSTGIQSFQMTSLKPATKRSLYKLLLQRGFRPIPCEPVVSPIAISSKVVSPPVLTKQPSKKSPKELCTAAAAVPGDKDQQYGPFDKEKLRFLHKSICDCMQDGSLIDVLKIIKENENINGGNDDVSLNIRKLKDVTKHYLFKYFTDNDSRSSLSRT